MRDKLIEENQKPLVCNITWADLEAYLTPFQTSITETNTEK